MKYTTGLYLALGSGWVTENTSFHFFAMPKQHARRRAFSTGEIICLNAESSPHPPDEPPPSEILSKQEAYFASPAAVELEDEEETEEIVVEETPEPAPVPVEIFIPPPVPAKPWMTDEQKQEINAAASRFVEEVWTPLFAGQVQSGVPPETIKGAALAAATLAFLASKGLVVTSAAGLSAAYVAISQGVAGDVFRTVGGITWDVTESVSKIVQMATANADQMTGLTKELAAQVIRAVQESQDKAVALQDAKEDVEEATEAFLDSQEDLARVLQEAEMAIGAADAAIAQADETLESEEEWDWTEEARLADEETKKLEVEAETWRIAEAKRLEKEARLAEEEATRLAAEAEARRKAEEEAMRLVAEAQRLEEEEAMRLAAEAEARRKAEEEAMRLVAEAQRLEEEEAMRLAAEAEAKRKAEEEAMRLAAEAESKRLEEEARLAEEEATRLAAEAEARHKAEEEEQARLEEELRQAEEAVRMAEENDDEDDEWLDAVEMAQKGMEGRIVGIDDAIQDDGAKANWDAAGALAQELLDEDEDDDTLDLEALGRAARLAVEKYEAGLEDEDFDDDLLAGEDLEELASAARQAVEAFRGDDYGEEEKEEGDSLQGFEGMMVSSSNSREASSASSQTFDRDWSQLTVAKLKDELRLRGLRTYGKKSELVAMLEDYDREQAAGTSEEAEEVEDDEEYEYYDEEDDGELVDDDDFDLGGIDLEELGRQARAAVEIGAKQDFDMEEPSDEVLMQLETEETTLLDPSFLDEDVSPVIDYSTMTVSDLKEELKSRGLRVSGKKAELIARLEEDDNS